jgi:hypothetical protein
MSAWRRRRLPSSSGSTSARGQGQQLAEQESVDIKLYQVIYDAIDDVKKAMVGMLAPIMREKILGKAEVRQIFNIPKAGTIGGSFVTEGKITRKAQLRLVRDSVVIYTARSARCGGSRTMLGGRAGLRMWSVDRGLRRPQGRRRDRGVRGRIVAPTLENPGGDGKRS